MKAHPARNASNIEAGAGDLPAGAALPIHIVARALRCNRSQLMNLIEQGELEAIVIDIRGKGSSRACIRVFIEKGQILAITGKLVRRGERSTKRARISPTRSRRHPRPADAHGGSSLILKRGKGHS